MLFQLLLNVIVFLLKMGIWAVFAFAAVPFGIYMALHNLFPIFTADATFWFCSVFGLLTNVVYFILWKPILWIVGTVSILGAEQ